MISPAANAVKGLASEKGRESGEGNVSLSVSSQSHEIIWVYLFAALSYGQ